MAILAMTCSPGITSTQAMGTDAGSSVSSPNFQVGDQLTVTARDIAFGGEGVARVGEFVFFVPFLMSGEEALVEVTEVKKRFGRATLKQLVKASPDRVTPVCPVFTECGGCQYQHIRYETQLSVKHSQVASLMERIGRFSAEVVHPVVPCPAPYGYRNRIMIRSQWDKTEQRLKIGFLKNESRLVVDIDSCAIAEPEISDKIRQVRASPPPKGGMKVVLRVLPSGWIVPNDSFFQNNFHALPSLVDIVGASLERGRCDALIDAYCGVGFFSLSLAHRLKRFIGVEIDGPAITAARDNAKQRGITNGEFRTGRTEHALPAILAELDPDRSCILLDPPRAGCDPEALATIASQRLRQIIYVSCHPATLARDLRTLCDTGGYQLTEVRPVDMFPQTQHVECVATLDRPN